MGAASGCRVVAADIVAVNPSSRFRRKLVIDARDPRQTGPVCHTPIQDRSAQLTFTNSASQNGIEFPVFGPGLGLQTAFSVYIAAF